MKRTLLSVMIAATAATPMLTQAASSIQFTVTGALVPSTCDITMPGGSTINYGKIASDTLKTDETTQIGGDMHTSIRVACAAPTLFAITPIDVRAASKITVAGQTDAALFGLGTVDDKKIGAYTVDFTNATTADGKTLTVLRTADISGKANLQASANVYPNQLSGFAEASGNAFTAYKDVTTDVSVKAYIQKASELPLTKNIPLDGLATFEVRYL